MRFRLFPLVFLKPICFQTAILHHYMQKYTPGDPVKYSRCEPCNKLTEYTNVDKAILVVW